ncbi:hypothetical protein DFS34DRAFT_646232 [Phlyctochytrium arcticum]|nr:hypothetical protein DFS34DRAFT_654860 [Phlyctochytrium arcticum]KAI9104031.1 hypothetical protein DFS34DRAFT_646232 [Phlyctochytrium arcticum]
MGRASSPSRISALGLDRISARVVYNADNGSGEQADEGFTFAVEPGLRLLSTNSYLVLLDSTRKTNRFDWRLFTCMVRDNFGSWLPAAQFFVRTENADAVAKGLLELRKMVREVCSVEWQPRNMQIDQSNIENNGIRHAFLGMAAGEEEIKICFCKVHVVRTLMRRVASHHNAFAKVLIALNKTTYVGATAAVEEAMQGAPAFIANYIQRNWTNREEMECWTMAAPQHSPILLSAQPKILAPKIYISNVRQPEPFPRE